MKFPTYRIVSIAYLGILVLGPIAGLFWQSHWGWWKANWILYPFMIVALLVAVRKSRKEPRAFLLGIGATLVYTGFFIWHGGDFENLARILFALMPLLLITPIRENISARFYQRFWVAYLLMLLVPIVISVLQLIGKVPYYDSGMAYNLYPGRISGGYLKPNNLNAVLFPAYLYGIYLFFHGRKTAGLALSAFVMVIVLVSGLRTSVIAFGLVFFLTFFPRFGNAVIRRGFQYGIFIVIGISSFYALSMARENFGLSEGLRRRLPMWMLHAEQFFEAPPMDIALGKGVVQLPATVARYDLASLSEVHNNDFRIMIVFGIAGYLLYGLLLRHVAAGIIKGAHSELVKFLKSACLVHLLIYSITNEPAFYPAIFWPLTAWIVFDMNLQTHPA